MSLDQCYGVGTGQTSNPEKTDYWMRNQEDRIDFGRQLAVR